MPRLIEWRRERSSLAATVVVVGGALAGLSTLLPWFSYSFPRGASTATLSIVGLHDVTGKAMLLAAFVEIGCGLRYLRGGSARGRRVMRVVMVAVGFFMITVPLAAMAHAGAVPGSPAVDGIGDVGPAAVDASGAIGVIVALLSAFAVLGASWLTVLDDRPRP
jgi:hypothetical protein